MYAGGDAGLEILAVPAIPLTMTAGVIFGPLPGTVVVSVSATVAATAAFLIARYAARDKVWHTSLVQSDCYVTCISLPSHLFRCSSAKQHGCHTGTCMKHLPVAVVPSVTPA